VILNSDDEINDELAKFYSIILFTPILFLISWLLEMAVDTPAKNFTRKVDM